MIRSLLLFPALALAAFAQDNIPQPALPPPSPLVVPARIGVMGNANISLSEVVERVLANDRDLAVSRILREEAGYSLKGAKGFYDPRLGLNTFRQRTISPVSSIIGGAANGKLTSEQVLFDPQLTGAFPILGGTYRLDFTSSRTRSDSTFITLNPQFPTSVSLNLNQPLWKGRSYDDARHRIEVARNNIRLSGEQFRQRVIEIVTLAVQSYWELDYAYRNLQVQLEAVQLAEQQDASNRRQVEQGLLAPTDVVATQTQIATFSQNFFAAQQAVTAAENALKVLMLADRSDLMWGMALIPEERAAAQESLPPLDEALRNALAARPELAESSITIDNNKADLRLSQELTKPQVDGYANLSVSGLAGHSLPPGAQPLYRRHCCTHQPGERAQHARRHPAHSRFEQQRRRRAAHLRRRLRPVPQHPRQRQFYLRAARRPVLPAPAQPRRRRPALHVRGRIAPFANPAAATGNRH